VVDRTATPRPRRTCSVTEAGGEAVRFRPPSATDDANAGATDDAVVDAGVARAPATSHAHAQPHLKLLTWNVNGIHMQTRAGIGAPASGAELGDGWDLESEFDAKLRTAAQVVRENGYAAAVLQETHMSAKEMRAAVGCLKRVHGLEAFGTAGRYSPTSKRHSRGVLVVWDPDKLMCEGRHVVLATRIVRVHLRALADGSAFQLIGAYMPNTTDTAEHITEAWELLHVTSRAPRRRTGR
jgi:exonuclease III